MAAHGAVTARRGSIARLEQGFRTQTMASRRERTNDSPTRWRFRLPSPGTFRLQPCGGPRTASGPRFNLIALRGRRRRDTRPSLRPGQEFAARACRSLRRIGAPALRPAVVTRRKGSDGASDAVLEGLANRAADGARGGSDNRTSRRNAGLSTLFVRRTRPRTSRIVIGRVLIVPGTH